MVSGVYAPVQQREKESFWNHLLQLSHVVELPWCLIGDFNELANPSEKNGGGGNGTQLPSLKDLTNL